MAATATSRAPTDLGASSLPRDLSEDGGAGSLDNATGGAPAAAAASDPVAPLRVKTLQIRWHAEAANGKNAPILSIDMHPTLPVLATAGADSEVKVRECMQMRGSARSPAYCPAIRAPQMPRAGHGGRMSIQLYL